VEVQVGSKFDGLIEDERWLVDELGTTMILERRLGLSTDLLDNAVPIKCTCLRSLAYPSCCCCEVIPDHACSARPFVCSDAYQLVSIGEWKEWTKPESKAEGFRTNLLR